MDELTKLIRTYTLKHIAAVLLSMLLPAFAFAEFYIYPSRIELNTECTLPLDILARIERSYSDPDAGQQGIARATAVDLNLDGSCEIFLDEPAVLEGNGNEFTLVLIKRDEQYMPSGDIPWSPQNWWYGEAANGYPRILVTTYDGPRTNPRYVTDVYIFDGEKYVIEFDATVTHGFYQDEGLKAYRAGQYDVAARYYQNAYRMRKDPTLAEANDLALVLLRQERYDEARSLIEHHLQQPNTPALQASAHFNLGLIAEATGNIPLALDNYRRAEALKSTKARQAKLKSLEGSVTPTVPQR